MPDPNSSPGLVRATFYPPTSLFPRLYCGGTGLVHRLSSVLWETLEGEGVPWPGSSGAIYSKAKGLLHHVLP